MTAARHILADRQVERTRRISQALCDVESATKEAVDLALDKLQDERAFSVHRDFSAWDERKLIQEAVALAVSRALLASGWVDVPDEVRWLHVDRFADAAEIAP